MSHGYLVGLFFIFFCQSAFSQTWLETRSVEGNFKVLMPMASQRHAVDNKAGTSYRFVGSTEDEKTVFQVSYLDVPASYIRQSKKDTILDNAEKEGIKRVAGTLTTRSVINLGPHPGREFHFTATSEGHPLHLSVRAILVENRLYTLGVLGIDRPVDKESTKRFFESFGLLGRQ